MKYTVQCCLVLLVFLPSTWVQGAESLVLYDDFSTVNINPDKWYGTEGSGGRETRRSVSNGRLRLLDQVYGNTGTNTGSWGGSQQLEFINPAKITTIKATVAVGQFEAVGCSGNPGSYSWADAFVQAYFFNTGTPIPGNCTNDVQAYIMVLASTNTSSQPQVLQVLGRAQLCNNSNCSSRTTIVQKDLGAIAVGQKTTLYLKWDKPNHRFIFRRDKRPAVYAPYDVKTYPDTSPPGFNGKRLRVDGAAANCTDTPRPVGFMDAFFDNVYINK